MQKKIIIWLMFFVFMIPALAQARNLIPDLNVKGLEFKWNGYFQGAYIEDDPKEELKWQTLRLKTWINTPTRFSFLSEVNVAEMGINGREPGNWLRRAEVSYKLNEIWTIRGGRLYTAVGRTIAAPSALETVAYPRQSVKPSAIYGYGVQLEGRLGDGWNIITDIIGASGQKFYERENWDYMEVSAWLKKDLNEKLSVAGAMQLKSTA